MFTTISDELNGIVTRAGGSVTAFLHKLFQTKFIVLLAVFEEVMTMAGSLGRRLGRVRRKRSAPRSVRLVFSYDEEGIRLIRAIPRTKTARPADQTRASLDGAIVAELHDADSRVLFKRVLYDPFPLSVESSDGEGGGFRRTSRHNETGLFTFVVPDDPCAAEVVVLAGQATRLPHRAVRSCTERIGERTVLVRARFDAGRPALTSPTSLPVNGVEKIVDHTESALGFNLVIMGDGYTLAELDPGFVIDAQNLVNGPGGLEYTVPFDRQWGNVNVYRIDTESADSGLYDPNTGIVVNTYYDASRELGDATGRLVKVNQQTAIDVANQEVSNWDALVVIVNDTTPAPAGSGVAPAAVYTSGAGATIGIHEMGHATFGLADEYDHLVGCDVPEPNRNVYPEPGNPFVEPTEPNITGYTSATGKWADRIDVATPLPTSTNPDPTLCDERSLSELEPPVVAGTIGTFEGAGYYHSGLFRPTFTCRMRKETEGGLPVPFCAICESVIESRLIAWFTVDEDDCFVATAVYGDRQHADVKTLRRWRDRNLQPTAPGRFAMRPFTAVYYWVGPRLASLTTASPWVARTIRRTLERLAAALRRRE